MAELIREGVIVLPGCTDAAAASSKSPQWTKCVIVSASSESNLRSLACASTLENGECEHEIATIFAVSLLGVSFIGSPPLYARAPVRESHKNTSRNEKTPESGWMLSRAWSMSRCCSVFSRSSLLRFDGLRRREVYPRSHVSVVISSDSISSSVTYTSS